MVAAILLQWFAVLVTAAIALMLSGPTAAGSALLGGMAAAIPNTLFAARLGLHRGRRPESYPVVFFLGEFIKIGLTILLFGAVIVWGGEQHWLALTLGLIVTLKAPLFALWYAPDGAQEVLNQQPGAGPAPEGSESAGSPRVAISQ